MFISETTVERQSGRASLHLPQNTHTKSSSLTNKHRKDSTVDSHDIHSETTNRESASAPLRGSDQLPLRNSRPCSSSAHEIL